MIDQVSFKVKRRVRSALNFLLPVEGRYTLMVNSLCVSDPVATP